MEELISKKDLHDNIVKLELSALEQMKILAKSGNTEEYNKMNAVLMERTAFKYDVVDAPVILKIPDTGIGDLSDGYHTFNGLYEQRAILFAALVKAYKDKSWKSHRHEDGELCFGGGWFIVGIDTPKGSYTYHYESKYWDMFDCAELPRAKHWDGHTEADAETRLLSLNPEPHWIPCSAGLPKTNDPVNVTWVNHNPEVYYMDIKDKPFTATAHYHNGHWYWYSSVTQDYLNEYDVWTPDLIDKDVEITAWMPLPEPYKGVTE